MLAPSDFLQHLEPSEEAQLAVEAASQRAWEVESQREYVVGKVLAAKKGRAAKVLMQVEWLGGSERWANDAVGWSTTVDPQRALELMKRQLLGKTCVVQFKPQVKLLARITKFQAKKFFVMYYEDPNRGHDEWLDLVSAEKAWELV
jgi:hypothetical protein